MSLLRALIRGLRGVNSAAEAVLPTVLIGIVVYLAFTDPLRVIAFGVVAIALMVYVGLVRRPAAPHDQESPEP